MIDLQQFCGTDEFRPALLKPFTVGDFTYATNGRIMVRVPKRDGVQVVSDRKYDKPLANNSAAMFVEPPPYQLPPVPEPMECSNCNGSKKKHECPDCECECETCGGTGIEEIENSASIWGVPFNLKYVRMILALPGIKIASSAPAEDPFQFQFDGGVGCVMPMLSAYENHIELIK